MRAREDSLLEGSQSRYGQVYSEITDSARRAMPGGCLVDPPGPNLRNGWQQGDNVYEKNGARYFVVDSHLHYWDASPDNWVKGQEAYAKGWIECFHAYMSLGPPETHWPLEKFQKYSEDDMMRDVFDTGHVDVGIFQPTDLRDWYTEGFNTTERDGALAEKHPGKFGEHSVGPT
jgi:hypothetical protein